MNQYEISENQAMKRTKYLRLVALILVICIAGSLFANVSYILTHYHHDCTGHHCAVCEKIQTSVDNIVKMSKTTLIATFILFFGVILLQSKMTLYSIFLINSTPVNMKVRMNN